METYSKKLQLQYLITPDHLSIQMCRDKTQAILQIQNYRGNQNYTVVCYYAKRVSKLIF